jgi:hypothetical protein
MVHDLVWRKCSSFSLYPQMKKPVGILDAYFCFGLRMNLLRILLTLPGFRIYFEPLTLSGYMIYFEPLTLPGFRIYFEPLTLHDFRVYLESLTLPGFRIYFEPLTLPGFTSGTTWLQDLF